MNATQPLRTTVLSVHVPLIVLALAISAAADSGVASEAAEAAPPVATQPHRGTRVRDPAADFAKKLGLDPIQEAQVRRLLARRLAEIHKVWSNPAIAADDRVGAVKAINDETMAQIRALLTDEQRAKYFQPRAPGSLTNEPQLSVEDWLNASRNGNAAPGTPR